MRRYTAPAFIVFLLSELLLIANGKIDPDVNWRIQREETEHSQIMNAVHHLADVCGPRLTGSPSFKAACEWVLGQMKQWGMENARLERWDFSYPGWSGDKYSVNVVTPFKATLTARVVAWTPSTKGTVRARVVRIDLPEHPSEESLTKYLNSIKEKINGRIVLVGAPAKVPMTFNPIPKRREDAELQKQFDPAAPPAALPPTPEPPSDGPKVLESREIDERIDSLLLASGALVKISDAARDHGQIRVFANRKYTTSSTVPSIVIRNEDYGRISRILDDGTPVEMEVEIVNTIHTDGQAAFNVIAEIPGSDKKNEVVMMGAHIDSWHAGTGATDNATGVAVMMEAARILQRLESKPRRTIRAAFWGGEEQGLLGSKDYVKKHFGSFESPGPEYSDLAAYINLDSGTGRVRGASVFGPPQAAAILRQILAPFQDLGVIGVDSSTSRRHGGTDTTSFNWAGLPGVNLIQDPIEYFTHSWHTDLDTYERALEVDLKQCAIVVASMVYHLAIQDEMLPRFAGNSMPSAEK